MKLFNRKPKEEYVQVPLDILMNTDYLMRVPSTSYRVMRKAKKGRHRKVKK